ncbi:hypothetical protein HFP43_16760 [Streptomyces sp. SJ1-7]|nr:hypothetical protein [Streptomyces sp. SJ1-7]
MVVIRKVEYTSTSSLTPITIGFPPFIVTREKETPPSAAQAGTAASPVSATAAPPATAALHIVFPIPGTPPSPFGG